MIKSNRFEMKIYFKILLIASILLLSGCGNITGMQMDLTQLMVNFNTQLDPIRDMLIAVCYVLGVVLIGTGIFKLKAYGQQTVMMSTHASLGPALAYVIVGAGFLFVPTLLDVMTVSLWGYNFDQVQGYPEEVGDFADIMIPVVRLIQIIGLIAFMRGWLILLKLGSQGSPPGTLGKGLMHMIGGILAINIMGTIDILRQTFGLV